MLCGVVRCCKRSVGDVYMAEFVDGEDIRFDC